jgi:hypothetical protein
VAGRLKKDALTPDAFNLLSQDVNANKVGRTL